MVLYVGRILFAKKNSSHILQIQLTETLSLFRKKIGKVGAPLDRHTLCATEVPTVLDFRSCGIRGLDSHPAEKINGRYLQ